MKIIYTILLVMVLSPVFAQEKATITLQIDEAETVISKHIYGYFAEHLGRCIYDGLYVGKDHKTISHNNGVRNDIIAALKQLDIPNLRWPGGCFADIYHWKDAIGPQDQRVPISNISWGGQREDNSFGTHEFLNMCEELGAEPYLALNMNSGTVREAMEWVQYVNHANNSSQLTDLRAENGREVPWNVTYWGIGNESWGCGGNMTVDHYVNLYRQYATAITSYSNTEKLYRIAVGPGSPDYNWTEQVMKQVPLKLIEGLSVHHYSVFDWNAKGSSYEFTEHEYFKTMSRAWFMEEFIEKNKEIMDRYDPDKKVALIVDEWGGWYESDPRGDGILYQQNTIRDAMIAGISLDVFNNHADRVRMANLAQMVNVLQAVILTEGEKMILTPTYHVMDMYKVHHDSRMIPLQKTVPTFSWEDESIPAISASASLNSQGVVHISITNISQEQDHEVVLNLNGFGPDKVSGRILSGTRVQDHNTFDQPDKVAPQLFEKLKIKGEQILLTLPAHSLVVLRVEK